MRALLLVAAPLALALTSCNGAASGSGTSGTFTARLVAGSDTVATVEGDLPAPVPAAARVAIPLPRPVASLQVTNTVWPLADSLSSSAFLLGYVDSSGDSVLYATEFDVPRFATVDSAAAHLFAVALPRMWVGAATSHQMTVQAGADSLTAFTLSAPAPGLAVATLDATALVGYPNSRIVVRFDAPGRAPALVAYWRAPANGGWYASALSTTAAGVASGDLGLVDPVHPQVYLADLGR